MAEPSNHEVSQPTDTANVVPMGSNSRETRQIIDGVTSGLNDRRMDDTWRMLYVFAAGFLILAGLFLYGYNRLADKIEPLDKSVTRIEQKLDDLIQRVPPVQTPVPRR